MATNATEIKAAIDLMGPEDFDNGAPKLDVVRRIAGDDTITAEAVAAALVPAKSATAESKAAPGGGTGVAPPVIAEVSANATAANTGAAHTVDPAADKEDQPVNDMDPNDLKRAAAAEATVALAEVQRGLDNMHKQRTLVVDGITAQEKRKVELETIIEANTVQFSEAEMVKRIQAQTQARLERQAAARAKVAETMNTAGVRTFASPLDQALANGTKRSKVLGSDGKVFEAPHPRSPEGVRAYGNWVHGGQKLPA